VSCGERRGRPRFSYEQLAAQAATAAETAPPGEQRPRFSSGTTIIAGIATLLIAIGVGVLIGHDSNTTKTTAARTQPPYVINVGGNAGTSSSSGTATPSTTSTGKSKGDKARVTHVVVAAKAAKAANQAAAKVLGNNGGNLSKNVNQTVGGSCSGGAGCQGGKFTGNYFPSG
jgi:hypothetical protein